MKKIHKFAKDLSRLYGVKIRIYKNSFISYGYAHLDKNKIAIYSCKNEEKFLSIFFHELQHFINKKLGVFPLYHKPKTSLEEHKGIVYTGIRAERYTDKKAESLMKIYFPDLTFHSSYRYKDTLSWYKEEYIWPSKNFLKKRNLWK
jgi:hypothetical protein